MVQTVQATYRDGVFEPSESLDLGDGEVVTLSISVERRAGDDKKVDSVSENRNGTEGGSDVESTSQQPTDFPSLLEMIREIHESTPESAWDNVPTDSARNYKHYLYGHPKEEDR